MKILDWLRRVYAGETKETQDENSRVGITHEDTSGETERATYYTPKKSDWISEMEKRKRKPVKKEERSSLQETNREFAKKYLATSEWERNKMAGEDNPRTPEEEKAYWEEKERRKKEHYILLKASPDKHRHCVGFDLPTAEDAYEHFHGLLEEIWDYGDECNGHYLHTWDDGGRKLCLCHDCYGFVLVQKSEHHGPKSDDYYTDYFPVDTIQEAEQLNELYGGFDIETKWNGKKVFVSNGHVSPNYR